jgi:hypothetical protein
LTGTSAAPCLSKIKGTYQGSPGHIFVIKEQEVFTVNYRFLSHKIISYSPFSRANPGVSVGKYPSLKRNSLKSCYNHHSP